MGIVTMTREEFEREIPAAERAVEHGPVFVTANGKQVYVLMSIELYRTMLNESPSLAESPEPTKAADGERRPMSSADMLSMPAGDDIEFDPPRVQLSSLHVPDPKPERDALIAGTALVHGLTVVTRNVADFAATGVAVFDPWRA